MLADKNKHKLVVAAAGTGKTELLLNLLKEELSMGMLDPFSHKIVVFTFTNNAADELKVRLMKTFGENNNLINSIFVGTIHGWCRNFLEINEHMANSKVMDELEVSQLLIRISTLLGIEDAYDGQNIFRKIEKFQKDLEIFYNENFEISDVNISNKIRDIIKKYLEFLDKQRLIDFGNMIKKTITILNDELGDEEYHLFVDEYQDVNNSQVELFKKMLSVNDKSTIFAVGDPRQAIYQWRGGDVRRILDFAHDFHDSTVFHIDENHRSRPGIINYANSVANKISFENKTELHEMKKDSKRVDNKTSVIVFENENNPEQMISKEIQKLHDSNVQYSDIAILLRSVSSHGRELMRQFEKDKIPYYSPNKNSGIEFVKDFMFSIISIMEIFQRDREFQNAQEEEDCLRLLDDKSNKIATFLEGGSTVSIHKGVSLWLKKLTTPFGYSKKNKPLFNNEAYNFRRQFFDFCEFIGFRIKEEQYEIQEGFSAITQIMRGVEEIYRRRFDKIQVPRDTPYKILVKNLKWQLENQLEKWTEVGMGFNGGDRVTLSTVHASKGLQWPIVFTTLINDGKFPLRESFNKTSFSDEISRKYGTGIEDERRLWYVCITRARDRLYILPKGNLRPSPFTLDVMGEDLEGVTYLRNELDSKEVLLSDIVNFPRRSFKTFGVSDILMLMECPLEFHFRKYAGIDVPVGEQFGAGNIIHETIHRIVQESNHVTIPEIVKKQTYLPLAELFTEDKILKSTLKKVKALASSGILENIDLTEYKFAIDFDYYIIHGIIDATLKSNTEISIIDWKNSLHQEFLTRYKNQIRLYSWAMRLIGYQISDGYIYDLSRKDGNNLFTVDISENSLEVLKNTIRTNYETLNKQLNLATPNAQSCSICDTVNICPYRIDVTNVVEGEINE